LWFPFRPSKYYAAWFHWQVFLCFRMCY
jgi:hypothetical protein